MRYAIYFTPPAGDRLAHLAAGWLGRNAFTGRAIEPRPVGRLSAADVAHHTAAPRRYGFHGTLKAPFELAPETDEAELLRAMMRFCGTAGPVAIPRLRIERLGPFFALTPAESVAGVNALADRVVREFDGFRAFLGEAEIERRNPARLTRRQLANLYRWGYPHVGEDFRFHMTLSGPVEAGEAEAVEEALQAYFAPALAEPVILDSIALFVEPAPGAPFVVHSLHPLGAVSARKSA